MILAAEHDFLAGKDADVGVLTWQSQKTDRAGSFTLVEGSNAMSEGLAEAERVTSWIFAAKAYWYPFRGRHAVDREMRVTTIMGQSPDCDIITKTDAKSLCDCLNWGQFASTEKRQLWKLPLVVTHWKNLGGQRRWFPRELAPADGLTELKGNARPLL